MISHDPQQHAPLAPWDRVTYRLPAETEGPELEGIAMRLWLWLDANPRYRLAGAELIRTDEDGHWVDLWIDSPAPAGRRTRCERC
jgi:hypothetical protein